MRGESEEAKQDWWIEIIYGIVKASLLVSAWFMAGLHLLETRSYEPVTFAKATKFPIWI
jgi:hypothetical protein